jgi:hypothetical protein
MPLNDQLQNTLRTLIRSGWQSNPAMHKIINDYAKYHTAFVIAGGLFTLILMSLSVVCWAKFSKIPQTGRFKWRFEKNVYFSFGLLNSTVALLMAFIVVVNATTAFDPLHGFLILIDELTPSSQGAQLHRAYSDWIHSGSSNIPDFIEQHLRRRVIFHTTKAIVCGIMLIIFTTFSIRIWSTLIKGRNASDIKWRLREKVLFVAGIATITLSLLMMIIVVANLQGAVAPITLTLLFGAEFPVVRFDR